jgi:hypothetical protein
VFVTPTNRNFKRNNNYIKVQSTKVLTAAQMSMRRSEKRNNKIRNITNYDTQRSTGLKNNAVLQLQQT